MRFHRLILGVLLAALPISTAVLADGAEDSALCYEQFRSGEHERAVEYCSLAIQSGDLVGGELVTALLNRGVAYKQMGNLELAIADYSAALTHAPDDALLYSNRANAYRETGELGYALADANHALEISVDSPRSFYVRGAIFEAIGDTESARKDYLLAAQLQPANEDYRRKAEAFAVR